MMSQEAFLEEAENWDLPDAALVFSDWLLEREEIRWANLVRWLNLCNYYSNEFSKSRLLINARDIVIEDRYNESWIPWAKVNDYPIIEE